MRSVHTLVASILLFACGGTTAAPAEPHAQANVRYYATVPTPVSEHGDVEEEALRGAAKFLAARLAAGGGMPRDAATGGTARPTYVFHVAVGTMQAEASGRTRASLTTVVRTEDEGRVVGILRGTATAYVERTEPLAIRQLRAIEGAIEGALKRLPELLDRLERDARG